MNPLFLLPFLIRISDYMKLNQGKLVLQGGLNYVPMKNGLPKRVRFGSGVYVTANSVGTE